MQAIQDITKRAERPIKAIQFGEGNFLRAFIDWQIDILNEKTDFNGDVIMVQPLAGGMADMINAQNGFYTTVLRGIENGKEIEDYFNKVLEDRELPAIAATSHEAMTYGQEYFAETVELLDEDYLVSLLDRDVEAEKPGDGGGIRRVVGKRADQVHQGVHVHDRFQDQCGDCLGDLFALQRGPGRIHGDDAGIIAASRWRPDLR